ncbi:hypothetical protein HDU91_002222 [Kappamyces sp. JEL0680]|nr:hypothetical protein HDU91_002222 [Kappamyces sp. JEL0680]
MSKNHLCSVRLASLRTTACLRSLALTHSPLTDTQRQSTTALALAAMELSLDKWYIANADKDDI